MAWGASSPESGEEALLKKGANEVSSMEIVRQILTEEHENEAVIEQVEPDPSDIADRQYKEWLENRYLKELENEQKQTKG